MRKIILFSLGFILLLSVVSCKKKEVKLNNTQNESINLSSDNSKNNKIDFDWSKMNYNMLSSLFYDVQLNPEKYNNKRFKLTGNFYSSIYEGNRYYSVLVWDPTGCCPAGLDFLPPADMKYPEDFPALDTRISVTCILNYSEDEEQEYFSFPAEEIVWENN